MACGHGNLLTLGCCTSWSKVGQATCQNTDAANHQMEGGGHAEKSTSAKHEKADNYSITLIL